VRHARAVYAELVYLNLPLKLSSDLDRFGEAYEILGAILKRQGSREPSGRLRITRTALLQVVGGVIDLTEQ
jgi:hypothetical protein